MSDAFILIGVFAVGLLFTICGAIWLISPNAWLHISRRYLGGGRDPEWGQKMTGLSARFGAGAFILFGLFFMYEASRAVLSMLQSHAR